jgi:hypothetical protein
MSLVVNPIIGHKKIDGIYIPQDCSNETINLEYIWNVVIS